MKNKSHAKKYTMCTHHAGLKFIFIFHDLTSSYSTACIFYNNLGYEIYRDMYLKIEFIYKYSQIIYIMKSPFSYTSSLA